MDIGYIAQCKLNEMDAEFQELQAKRQNLLDEATEIEMQMRKISFQKEQVKREYIKNAETN